jgi:hypothetical protein
MKTFREFIELKEGGNLWANPGAQDKPGTKRTGRAWTTSDSTRFDGTSAGSVPAPMTQQKKLKK